MIPLASKYQVFCQAVSRKSFTEAARVLHHSRSAVSQAVKAVEQEVGLTLVLRKKDGIELTSDGKKVYPYIQSVRLRYDHGGGRAGTGVSLLYRSYLKDYTGPAVVLPIRERPERHVAITWKRGNVLSYATRKFMDHMADYYRTR